MLAIGECALWDNKIYGLVAPGYQMARIAAATLAGEDACFSGADMSTKLKLLGVDVASFGDAQGRTPGCQSYQWTDGPQQIYKNRRQSGRQSPAWRRAGGGCQRLCHAAADDAERHGAAAASGESDPARAGGAAPKALGVAALPDSAPICSCHNVSKGDICQAVNNGAGDMSAIKSCTRAATGCGGCSALVKQVMEYQLAEQGVEVKKTFANISRGRARDLPPGAG